MAIRVSKLLREANIGMQTLSEMLSALGVNEPDINPNTKISDDVEIGRASCRERV